MQNIQAVKAQIPIDYEKIAEFCQHWKITEFALFGSILRDDFRLESSDIDVLVSFAHDTHWTLFDLVDMEEDIQKIFQRKVDLVSRRGIERSQNYLRRQAILNSAKVIYAAA
ncbi:nucleotidyltransferase family protein [Candidatus Synechococcus calcipolaris G9]|uniref:Nucleotidyltransferase family protein n=1 Tax=Candidatus Synechococcus calcipolaris G9 TaxID=1497997 RepID=A0ABT6F1M5_9SYNE|nr:nucleotidyltransferase family protein [Candidatus Synechococcus calcipolaris]MDG2991764.1 nucleotidyltransferase family protein [Candidatus Synechococcus calcipolaris G9]